MPEPDMVVVYCPNTHPSFNYWANWCAVNGHLILWDMSAVGVMSGDWLFLISCTEKLGKETIDRYKTACVIHESDLPNGRGWSPLAWQILEGKNSIKVSAIVCDEKIDAGDILAQDEIALDGSELADEICLKAFHAKARLVDKVIAGPCNQVAQFGEGTYYRRRTPEDSRIDPDKSISEQFNLLRICEPRFPAFFEKNGHRYEITLRKVNGRD